jgi:hypothetical protein
MRLIMPPLSEEQKYYIQKELKTVFLLKKRVNNYK